MATETGNKTQASSDRQYRWIAGGALLLIGVLILLRQFAGPEWADWLSVPALGVIFMVWGSTVRAVGLLIPGGVLTGAGLGTILTNGPLSHLSESASNGVFLLCLGFGFAVITLFAWLFADCRCYWPVIVGAIVAGVGVALLLVGEAAIDAIRTASRFWPLALVALGLYVIFQARLGREGGG